MFEDVATLLHAQGALEHRVRAWHRGAQVVAHHPIGLGEVYRGEGIAGLEAIAGIGYRLARASVEILRTGTLAALQRLRGAAGVAAQLTALPGIGEVLAERIHHTLGISTVEQLRAAIHDGRLATVPGLGSRKVRALEATLDAHEKPTAPKPSDNRPPPIAMLLEVDRLYRWKAHHESLPRIAPKRNNPTRDAWLPIWHHEHGEWSFTALYSNTALAHQLHKTDDWVVLHYEHDHVHGQATVVTEWKGTLSGRRVVRGREDECADHYRQNATPAPDEVAWGDRWRG